MRCELNVWTDRGRSIDGEVRFLLKSSRGLISRVEAACFYKGDLFSRSISIDCPGTGGAPVSLDPDQAGFFLSCRRASWICDRLPLPPPESRTGLPPPRRP